MTNPTTPTAPKVYYAPAAGDIFGAAYSGAYLDIDHAGDLVWQESNSTGGYYTVASFSTDSDGYRVVNEGGFARLLAKAGQAILEAEREGHDPEYRQHARWEAKDAAGDVLQEALDRGYVEDLAEDDEDEDAA